MKFHAKARRKPGVMNKTEAAYAQELENRRITGLVREWYFEAVTFKLAPDTRYTPDFLAILSDGTMEFTEVKGFLRDDAAVKFKIAASQHPWALWQMVKKTKAGFEAIYEL